MAVTDPVPVTFPPTVAKALPAMVVRGKDEESVEEEEDREDDWEGAGGGGRTTDEGVHIVKALGCISMASGRVGRV